MTGARLLILALIVFAVAGCKGARPREVIFIAPELQPLVAKFEDDAKKYGVEIKITNLTAHLTDKLEDPVTGECVKGDGTPIVRISRSFWNTASEVSKELALYHELGHCVLGRDHDDTTTLENEEIPRSIMASHEISASVYLAHYDYYLRELFGALSGS